jgi:multiple sugar transport system ATP-binding protein
MRADIAKLQHELETTTVYVTHDQIEAMTMGDRVAVMNRGELQQCDTPQRLYDLPENLFVAGFIGTPPMNLLDVPVTAENGGVSITVGGATVAVPDAALRMYPRLREYAGRSAVAGIRSQALFPASERPDLPTFTARVELVEALGSESMAYFHVENRAIRSEAVVVDETLAAAEGDESSVIGSRPNLVAEFPPHLRLGINEDVPVALDVAKLHFFDEETGAPLR